MRTPTDGLLGHPSPISLAPAVGGSIVVTEGTKTTLGSLSAVGAGTTVIYTPNIRVPRYPEATAFDSFTYTGMDVNGVAVTGIVYITIDTIRPNDRFINNIMGTTTINSINTTALTRTLIDPNGGNNALAANNVDGIVLSSPGGSTITYWDPVTDLFGSISVAGLAGFDPTRPFDDTASGTFDQDRAQYWIFSDANGTTSFFYRISFDPFVTGSPPVVNTVELGFVYTNNALTTLYTGNWGDSAWDPSSKRIYIVETGGDIGYILPYDMRWTTTNLGLQRFSQGNINAGQVAMTWDGTRFYGQVSATSFLYEINRRPATASSTALGPIPPGGVTFDCSVWPVTQPLI
jgi:hypothetical protein